MSRLTRREMKRDELVTTLARISLIVDRHARAIIISAAAIILLAGAVTAGYFYSKSREAAAQTALADVREAATAPVLVDGNIATTAGVRSFSTEGERSEEVIRLADVVLAEYPSSTAAGWATYMKAVGLHDLERNDEALETLEPVSGADGLLGFSAGLLQARVLEQKGDLEEASSLCARVAEDAPAKVPVEMALMEQARLLGRIGRVEEARSVYRRVTEEYPDSPFATDATQRLAELGDPGGTERL